MAKPQLPIKKAVELRWQRLRLELDVAQDLFSSFQVDRGSRMLLDSLDPAAFPERGCAVDFGCGYGVLGIAWQARMPGWSMRYVDRDALAVAFSRHNAERLVPRAVPAATFECTIAIPFEPGGYNLVLWNVPGKAGRAVIAGLLDAVIDGLAVGGLLAAVVVHPLADLFTEAFQRDDAEVVRAERGKEHAVVHLRRTVGNVVGRDPFAEGVFDRAPRSFAVGDMEWTLTPVIGLPEYDSLDHATELAARALKQIQDVAIRHWMVVEPGVGHLPMVASRLWPAAGGLVVGRDALAVRATLRALGEDSPVEARTVWGIPALSVVEPADLLCLALPEQGRQDDLSHALDALGPFVADDGTLVAHGRSTEVARLERIARRAGVWRVGKVDKLRGSACLALGRRALTEARDPA
jgi:hypothetical protein